MRYRRATNLSYDNLDKFLYATNSLLSNLLSDSKYSREEKNFFEYVCPNSIENFISGEIFSEGIIKISSQAYLSTDKKIFCQLSLAYLLHCRLNLKMERCAPCFFYCEAFDSYLYDILCHEAWENSFQWEKRDRELCRRDHFFDNFLKMSFTFSFPLSGMKYIWYGSRYSINDGHQFEIKIDFNYGSFMRFLLTENGNPIHLKDFKTTRSFWDWLVTEDGTKIVKLPRGNTPYRLEDGCTADIDLLIYTLCLGHDKKIFERLQFLRDEAYPNRTQIKPDTPNFSDETEEQAVKDYLIELLKDSKERLTRIRKEIRREGQVPKKIPKRILLEVNEDLKRAKLKPLF